ncbi:GNAT family N-acetyltransferase [Primorskyibacter flagellatus]|uniref:GNAT family N-acetyltransferase n=1 Tax=Primorskyibacter flagellatus TaxID=1387277 RepID=UPI003A8CE245
MSDRLMKMIRCGRYQVRIAETPEDIRSAQALRHLAFRGGAATDAWDEDIFDTVFSHMLVEEQVTGQVVCCYRFLLLQSGAEIQQGYVAQFYDLSALSRLDGRMIEMGRFCSLPGLCDPDILRLAWAAITRLVDQHDVTFLFGCASLPGTEAALHRDSLAVLAARYVAPDRWRPGCKAAEVVRSWPDDGGDSTNSRGCSECRPCCEAICKWAERSAIMP